MTEAVQTGVFTLSGVAVGGFVTWLMELSRRRHDARTRLDTARRQAYMRFADAATAQFAILEDGARQVRTLRWYAPRSWLAAQVDQRSLDAAGHMQRAFYDVKVLGPAKAAELGEALLVLVKEAVTLAQHPMSPRACSRKSWDDLLGRLAITRDAFLELAREERADR